MMNNQFLEDVKLGLASSPNFLSLKYFYEEKGDRIFQEIMALDEHYLTDCEFEIFSEHKKAFFELFVRDCDQPAEVFCKLTLGNPLIKASNVFYS